MALTHSPFFASPVSLPRQIALHLGGWIMFITFEIVVVTAVTGSSPGLTRTLIYYLFNIGLFYGCVFLTFPRAFGRQWSPIVLLPAFTLGLLAGYVVAGLAAGAVLLARSAPSLAITSLDVLKLAYRGSYFILLAAAYWFPWYVMRQRQLLADLEKDRLRTQNAYLHARLHPHLLFNSLHFLQHLHSADERGTRCILLLSDIMRYSLDEPDEDGTMPLHAELTEISHYLELQQLRTRNLLYIRFDAGNCPPSLRIIPLVLLSLVENVVHHGQWSREAPALIRASYAEGEFRFYTSNRVKPGDKRGSGLGLTNNQWRLERHYPGRHSFNFGEYEGVFEVQLRIFLHE